MEGDIFNTMDASYLTEDNVEQNILRKPSLMTLNSVPLEAPTHIHSAYKIPHRLLEEFEDPFCLGSFFYRLSFMSESGDKCEIVYSEADFKKKFDKIVYDSSYVLADGPERPTMKDHLYECIKDWLRKNGYDGLWFYCPSQGCGCTLDDFAPCGEDPLECSPGKIVRKDDDGTILIGDPSG